MPNRSMQGFTLLEMLVAVVMVGILTAIALPNFLGQTNKSRTTEATAVLSTIASGQGEYRFRNPGLYFQVGTAAAAPAVPAAGATTFNATATKGVAIGTGTNVSNAATGEAAAFAQTLGVDVGASTAGDRWRFNTMPRDAAGAATGNASGTGFASVDFTVSAYGITNANAQQTANLGSMLVNGRGLAQPILDINANN